MIRKYHNHKPQTSLWHRKEEPLNHHETSERQIKQSNQLSLPITRHQEDKLSKATSSLFKVFWVKTAKIDLLKKMVLRVVFIKLKFRWLQTGLSDWKNTKQLKFCLWSIFYAFFQMLHFSNFFEIFEIHQYFLVKLLNALNFI